MKVFSIIWLGLIFVVSLNISLAQAGVILCNNSAQNIQFAMIYAHFPRFGEPPTWPLKGWFSLEARNCNRILDGSFNHAYLSILKKKTDHVTYMAPFAPGTPEDIRHHTGATGIEMSFCIPTDAPYEGVYHNNLENYQRCQGGEYRQLFNLFVKNGDRTDFTVSVD